LQKEGCYSKVGKNLNNTSKHHILRYANLIQNFDIQCRVSISLKVSVDSKVKYYKPIKDQLVEVEFLDFVPTSEEITKMIRNFPNLRSLSFFQLRMNPRKPYPTIKDEYLRLVTLLNKENIKLE